ncbi:MAG: C25 family cysteine peptidase [Promethearchaeota archaeon]
MKLIYTRIFIMFWLIIPFASLIPPLISTITIVRGVECTLLSDQNNVDYLIITSELFIDDVQPLAIWKLQRGLIPAIKTVENISSAYNGDDLVESIRNCIRQFYEEMNIKWVVLAGSSSLVPTRFVNVGGEYVSCDHYYANLDDNWELNSDGSASILDYFDWEAEVYVGRLPADNNAQMRELVNRLINYEKNPPVGPWMKHALFAGAFARFNSDTNDNNVFDEGDAPEFDANRNHNWLKTSVFPSDWTSTLLGETKGLKTTDYYVDKSLNESNVIEEINNGVGAAMFDAHGSPTEMFRMIFKTDSDNDSLFDYGSDKSSSERIISTSSAINSEGKYGFYFLCACATGTFKYSRDCLSEFLLRTSSIGCIASSGSAYYDSDWYNGTHGGWYTQGLSSRFWEQFFKKGNNQPGKAFIEAKLDYVNDYKRLDGKKEGTEKTLIQYNLMGDPEVPVWTMIPSSLEHTVLNVENETILEVFSNDEPINQVATTLSNSTYYWRGKTNNEGVITLPVSSNELNNLTLTISKINYLPHQEGVENIPTTIPEISYETSAKSTPFPQIWLFIIFVLLITKKKRKNITYMS